MNRHYVGQGFDHRHASLQVLGYADVQTSVRAALQDDSVMVREAAVDLLGK